MLYSKYQAWKDFLDKINDAKKAANACAADPTNIEKWRNFNQKYYEAWRAGGSAALSVPGTSATGSVPTSRLDLIIGGASTAITNSAGLGN